MIQKTKVSEITLKHGASNKFFSVSGKGQFGRAKHRMFKTYTQALRYSVELSDYYQTQVIES